jgi:hypothetical protein
MDELIMYDPGSFTYGAELELVDWYLGTVLPDGCKWDRKDYTMVNSNGIANDPAGQLYRYGGEINTRPTSTIESQVNVFSEVIRATTPTVNYRCNLHIHVGVPGLKDDLEGLKRLQLFIDRYMPFYYSAIEPIPEPRRDEYPEPEAFKGAMKRFRRRHESHQYMMPKERMNAMLAASTPKEFWQAEAVRSAARKPMWHLTKRCGINLRELFEESGTIEFRHFPGTLDSQEFHDSLLWCKLFVEHGLNGKGCVIERYPIEKFCFPKFSPYIHELEVWYAYTSIHCNSRKKLIDRFAQMRRDGILVD